MDRHIFMHAGPLSFIAGLHFNQLLQANTNGHCPRSLFCGFSPLSWGWGTNSLSRNWLILGQNCILSSSSPTHVPATPHPTPPFPWLAFVPLSDMEEAGLRPQQH